MAQPNIFVSHSHNDDSFADRLVADLHEAGIDAWLDRTDLGVGNFQQRINDALTNCDWFVLVLTKSALESRWVQHEVDAANLLKNQGRIHDLIFIQAGSVEQHELPPLWGVYHIFDATTEAKYVSAVKRLVKAVGGLPKDGDGGDKPEPTPIAQGKARVVPVTTRQTLFGDVAGMTCPYCGVFNPLDDIEQVVDKAILPSTLWGSLPARCGKCSRSFYYAPPADR